MKKKTNLRDRDDLSTRDIGHFPKASLSWRFHCTMKIFSLSVRIVKGHRHKFTLSKKRMRVCTKPSLFW